MGNKWAASFRDDNLNDRFMLEFDLTANSNNLKLVYNK